MSSEAEAEHPAVQDLVKLLSIRTISATGPEGSYAEAAAFLKGLCEESGLATQIVELVAGYPMVWAKWEGSDPRAKSILLNSHYDVVPAVDEMWGSDPFKGTVRPDASGRACIYGRGAQDMKCVCIWYVHAIRELKAAGYVPPRTVWLSFVPDEEVGGVRGLKALVDSDVFRAANVGMALDEGLANPSDKFTLFYSERVIWWLRIRATGATGHASRFVQGAATHKLMAAVQRFLAFREEQEAKLNSHRCNCRLGDVTTLNLTMLRAGVSNDGGETFALNVLPTEAEAGFDIRIPPTVPLAEFEERVKEWTKEEGLAYEFIFRTPAHAVCSTDPDACPWWKGILDGVKAAGIEYDTAIFPAGAWWSARDAVLAPSDSCTPTPTSQHPMPATYASPAYRRTASPP